MLHLFVSPSAWAAGRDTGELTLRKSGMNGILSGERDILTWLVGRDAGSLRGHKVRHGLLRDFYTLFETIRTRTDARTSHLYSRSSLPLSGT